jgi:WhiB family redox-sensing transcriptional regulator
MDAAGIDWRRAAACRSYDPDLFFPVSPAGAPNERQVAAALAVCTRCPVRAACLDFALRTRQAHGVWGGVTEQELHSLRRRDVRPADTGPGKRRRDRVQADEPSVPGGLAREHGRGLPAAG